MLTWNERSLWRIGQASDLGGAVAACVILLGQWQVVGLNSSLMARNLLDIYSACRQSFVRVVQIDRDYQVETEKLRA